MAIFLRLRGLGVSPTSVYSDSLSDLITPVTDPLIFQFTLVERQGRFEVNSTKLFLVLPQPLNLRLKDYYQGNSLSLMRTEPLLSYKEKVASAVGNLVRGCDHDGVQHSQPHREPHSG